MDSVIVGEVGLSGEVRSIPFKDRRKAEAERFGMKYVEGVKHVKDLG